MTVRTSYGTGGIVVEVVGPSAHVATNGKEYPHFTIVYVSTDRVGRHSNLDRNWINECVAAGGLILKLLEANPDEVFTEEITTKPLDSLVVRNSGLLGEAGDLSPQTG